MRPALAAAGAFAAMTAAAAAAPQTVSIRATPTTGPAPLRVTFTAEGDAATYHWTFGDGAEADGVTVEHVYAAGRWTASVTARSAGETSSAQVTLTAFGVTVRGPQRVRWNHRVTYRGSVVPGAAGVPVTLAIGSGVSRQTKTRQDGTFAVRLRVQRPAPITASANGAVTEPLPVRVIPRLRTRLVGSGARGTPLGLAADVLPRDAGALDVTISRGATPILTRTFGPRARVALDTRKLATYRIRVAVRPNEGFTSIAHRLRADVVLPRLEYGTRSSAIVQVAERLRALRYAAPPTNRFDGRLLDAVYAFQKVQGLPRTGVVDRRFWRALTNPRTAIPRYAHPGNHLEVNKRRQVLYVVRAGRVALIVPVSTAGVPGTYTPVGRFAIYRKVVGFDPSPLGTLYDPMYFTGGYAIHGNPSVPPYPASHGCVRVPMWLAPHLFATNPYGEAVYVY